MLCLRFFLRYRHLRPSSTKCCFLSDHKRNARKEGLGKITGRGSIGSTQPHTGLFILNDRVGSVEYDCKSGLQLRKQKKAILSQQEDPTSSLLFSSSLTNGPPRRTAFCFVPPRWRVSGVVFSLIVSCVLPACYPYIYFVALLARDPLFMVRVFFVIQAGRTEGCQEECALCADLSSPCQNCYVGNPSATVCEHPETYLFWDSIHPTTDMHQLLAEAIRQCSKDYPKYDRPLVELLCSGHA